MVEVRILMNRDPDRKASFFLADLYGAFNIQTTDF